MTAVCYCTFTITTHDSLSICREVRSDGCTGFIRAVFIVVVDPTREQSWGQILGLGVMHVGEEHQPQEGPTRDGHDSVLFRHQVEVEGLQDGPDGETDL